MLSLDGVPVLACLLQALTDQLDATEKDQVGHNQELQRLSAWRDKVLCLETSLGELAGHSEQNAASPPFGPGTSPELKMRYLSRLFHVVCRPAFDMCRSLKSVLQSDLSLSRCGQPAMMPLLQGLGTGLALLVLSLGIFCFKGKPCSIVFYAPPSGTLSKTSSVWINKRPYYLLHVSCNDWYTVHRFAVITINDSVDFAVVASLHRVK